MATRALAEDEMTFEVKYSGLDVDRGRMSAVEVGPAIFGVGEMIGEASRVVFKDDARVRVEVRADLRHASFGIEFVAVALPGGLVPPLTLTQLAELANILGFGITALTTATMSVIGLYRWQKGRKIDSAERKGDHYEIKIGDDVTQVSSVVYNVYVSQPVREGFRALVKPLERAGVDAVSIRAVDNPPQVIAREEASYFEEAPLPEEDISTDIGTAILEVISPSFRPELKWRFARGEGTFFAAIADEKFLRAVQRHSELFGQGDALKVLLETRTTRTTKGFAYEYVVREVLEHIPAQKGGGQIPLFG